MKIAILVFSALTVVALAAQSATPAANGHEQWVAESLKEMQTVRVGMKRADVEKIFKSEGGLGEALHRTYVYRRCSYFKVDVAFSAAEPPSTDRDDKVVTISRPYLAWTDGD